MTRSLTPSEIWRYQQLGDVPINYLAEIKAKEPKPPATPPAKP